MQDKNYDSFFDEKTTEVTPEEQLVTMIDEAEKAPVKELQTGEMASGTVQSIGKEFVFVDVGLRNEAVIRRLEMMDANGTVTVQIGDTIDAFVVSTENDEIVLSKTLSGRKAKTKELIEAMERKAPIDGKVTGINKGGFNVTIMGRKAFCPFSHIDLKHVDNPNKFLSQVLPFVITRVEGRGRNIVLSRLPLLEKELSRRFDELEKCAENKKVIKGTVSKVSRFGVFVNLGDIEGLVHISEVSWDRAENLKQSFQSGQEIECIVLGVERKEPLRNSKISLSIRMVGENPWDTVAEKLAVGTSVSGTITRLTKFGAFVQLLPGIEGLIHLSEMSWSRKVRHPSDVVKTGDSVKVNILAVDEKKRSVSCSLKDIADNPWNAVADKYPIGSKVKGTVTGKTRYGYFVDLDEEITGLLVNDNIGKNKKGDINKGSTVEVEIEEIDTENQRISLSCGLEKVEIKSAGKTGDTKKGSVRKPTSEFGAMLLDAMKKKK